MAFLWDLTEYKPRNKPYLEESINPFTRGFLYLGLMVMGFVFAAGLWQIWCWL